MILGFCIIYPKHRQTQTESKYHPPAAQNIELDVKDVILYAFENTSRELEPDNIFNDNNASPVGFSARTLHVFMFLWSL